MNRKGICKNLDQYLCQEMRTFKKEKGARKRKLTTCKEGPKVLDPCHITSRDLSNLRFCLSW